jgi:hypothetical protein
MADGKWGKASSSGISRNVIFNPSLGIQLTWQVLSTEAGGSTTIEATRLKVRAYSLDGDSAYEVVKSVQEFDLTNVQYVEFKYTTSNRDYPKYDASDVEIRMRSTNGLIYSNKTYDPDTDLYEVRQLIDVSALSGLFHIHIDINANCHSGDTGYTYGYLYEVALWS